MPVDLKTLNAAQLRTYLANAERKGAAGVITDIVQEMHCRGLARRGDYAVFLWNQDRVDTALAPFAEIAATVKNNERKNYSQAGGGRIGTPKDHPEHIWIQSYSAIKISGLVNAVFGCEIKRPGGDPVFALYFNEGSETRREPKMLKTFELDQLSAALAEWEAIAQTATASAAEVS